MTDAELVAAVDQKIMLPSREDVRDWCNAWDGNWDPLGDWNCTWAVVEAMRDRGYHLELQPFPRMGFTTADFIYCDEHIMHYGRRIEFQPGNERRAILEAALRAIES